jgi:asparagine synthase (glutamine-hydrolysing)
MCGIFGVAGFSSDQLENARTALHTLQHRGPDQWNEFYDENAYLGHRRLSILDLSENGRQPMVSESGDVIVTVNGEIYNFQTLREELSAQYRFRSNSDSEVVLHGYTAWGIQGLLERIEGMYALVIYDRHRKRVLMARDRVGIKPLYYARTGSGLVWASELKAVASYCPSLTVDNTALYDFLTYQYIPAPKTMYRDCFKLEPAHYAEWDLSSKTLTIERYWQLRISEQTVEKNDAKNHVAALINQSVDEQMVSDVPVGFFLSGGIDSSVVVASASQRNQNIHTFSIGFTDKSHDETAFAAQVASRFNTQHNQKTLSGDSIQAMFTNIRLWYDEPFADLSCFPSFLVSQFARQHVTVALTGDGGDEVFGGYKWYSRFKILNTLSLRRVKFLRKPLVWIASRLPGPFKKFTEFLFLDPLELFARLKGAMSSTEKKTFREKWNIPADYDDYWYFRKYYRTELPVMTRLQYLDFNTYLPDDILTKVDRVSMAVALECRVPLLATRVVEYAFSLPESVRFQKYGLKGVLKAAFENSLPSTILRRSKRGFSIPTRVWNREVLGVNRNRFVKVLKEAFGLDIS